MFQFVLEIIMLTLVFGIGYHWRGVYDKLERRPRWVFSYWTMQQFPQKDYRQSILAWFLIHGVNPSNVQEATIRRPVFTSWNQYILVRAMHRSYDGNILLNKKGNGPATYWYGRKVVLPPLEVWKTTV